MPRNTIELIQAGGTDGGSIALKAFNVAGNAA